jgi:vacuolar-type H+-ATPase catalytic subunit A/Vma1
MPMSKQHYVAIAEVLNNVGADADDEVQDAIDNIAEDLADYFLQDNPRFDRERFLKAAGVEV